MKEMIQSKKANQYTELDIVKMNIRAGVKGGLYASSDGSSNDLGAEVNKNTKPLR